MSRAEELPFTESKATYTFRSKPNPPLLRGSQRYLRGPRRNVASTATIVEFDLETMFDGEIFSDFAVLFLLCHESRVEAEKSHECYLEQWVQAAARNGLGSYRDRTKQPNVGQ